MSATYSTDVEARLRQLSSVEVRRSEEMGFFDEKRVVDFLIADYDDYADGRVANSSIVIEKEEGHLSEGRIHAPTVVESYALEMAGTKEEVQEGVEVNVIDNVLHVYLDEGLPVETAIEVVEAITEGEKGTALERVKHNL